MLNCKKMENGKIFGISKSVFWRVVGICCGCLVFGVCVHSCKRSVNVDIDAKRNRVSVELVKPGK